MEPVGTCFTAMDSFSRFSEYSPCRTGKYIIAGKLKFMKMQIIWVSQKCHLTFSAAAGRVFTEEELMWKIKLCWSVPGSSSCWNHPAVTTARRSWTKIQIAHWLSNFSRLGIPQTRILPGGLRCCSHQGMYSTAKDSPDWPDVWLIFPLCNTCNTVLNAAVNLFIIQIMSSQRPSKELFHWPRL